MASKIRLLVAMDMLFLLFLALSGSTSGAVSEIFFYLAFLAPILVALNHLYTPSESSHASWENAKSVMIRDLKEDFSLSKEDALFTLPILVPAICLVMGVSYLTASFMGLFGYENARAFEEPFFASVITHALVPAILEELLFRFAPIKLLKDNGKCAFILSSVMFAFAHVSLFQIPYALLAGMIFALLYMATGSILPSMVLHFLNNLLSLLSIYGYLGAWVYPTIAALFVASVFVILKRRNYFKERAVAIFKKGEKLELSYHPIIFIATTLVLSISSLIA